METTLKVLRPDDEPEAPGAPYMVPFASTLDEIKLALFKLAFPGNPTIPEDCRLLASDGTEIDDVSVITVVPEGIIIVHPGEGFVDQGSKPKEKKMNTLSRLRGSLRKNKDEKEGEKKEDGDQKDGEEKKSRKRLSFFDSIRKSKASDYIERDAHLPDWLRLQKRIFTRYVNQRFRASNSKTRVDDLALDCKDALVLIEMLEIMSEKSFPDKKIKPQKVRIKQIDNCASLLAFAKECGIMTDCSAENIVDGDEKALLSFIYQIILKYMKLDENDEESAGMDVKQSLVLWLRNKLQGYDIQIDEKNLCKSFQDGMAFCALLHKQRPRVVRYPELIKEQKLLNLIHAFDVAEQYAGIQQYIEPNDVAKLDELGITVYLCDWFHGISFLEQQNSYARRLGKLVRMTILHDRLKAEYDERAKAFATWVEFTVKVLDDHTFDNTLEDIKAKIASFYQYKSHEKADKLSEFMELEAFFDDLALRLQNNNRPPYNCPKGLSIPDLKAAIKALEDSENRRNEAMQMELARQIKLAKLAARFADERAKIEAWTTAKKAYLQATEEVTSIATAQRHLNVLASYNKEWENVRGTKIIALKALSDEIVAGNYNQKAAIASQTAETENKFHNLPPLSDTKNKVLEQALETEKKKEQLRLDFAGAAKDFELYANDQTEVVSTHYFGDSLESVQTYNQTLATNEQEIAKALADRKAACDALASQLQALKVTENNYTTLTSESLAAIRAKVEDAVKVRRAAYEAELERQKANDALCRNYAEKISAYHAWVSKKKAAVNDKAQELEQKLALIKSETSSFKGESEAKIAELEALDAKILAAEIAYNNHATSTTQEAKIAQGQYEAYLSKLAVLLEAEVANKTSRGITAEQMQEISDNFRHFDKDNSGFLDKKEFRGCLQSLGQDAKPADMAAALAQYDKDANGKISRDEFTDYMLKRIGDTDSKEEILDAFTTINQKDYADIDHMTAVVNDTTFPPEHLGYLKKEMPAREGGYDFAQWTQAVFDR